MDISIFEMIDVCPCRNKFASIAYKESLENEGISGILSKYTTPIVETFQLSEIRARQWLYFSHHPTWLNLKGSVDAAFQFKLICFNYNLQRLKRHKKNSKLKFNLEIRYSNPKK